MKVKIINQFRAYFENCTVSDVYLPDYDERYCYALEDVARPPNVKIYGKTCIPEGVYEVSVTHSPKYGRDMVLLHNTDTLTVERDGVRFTGVRNHGGNTVDDSEGCILTAYNFDGDETIWKKSSGDIKDWVVEQQNKGYKVYWSITRK